MFNITYRLAFVNEILLFLNVHYKLCGLLFLFYAKSGRIMRLYNYIIGE